ncbi:MAG: hypothetical protein IAF58_22890 [Leptolyngbya sp.]|nr:hypothetical protein [Candidatus Melainabacteria bacterium]
MTFTNLNTSFEPPVFDRASLDGLEPLLDSVFSAAPPIDATPDSPITKLHAVPETGTGIGAEIFGADIEIMSGISKYKDNDDASIVINELCATIDLLRAQLSFSNSELKFSANRNHWLETQIATKEDQLQLLPDLMTRASQVTIAERELFDIRLDADRLLDETREIREIAEQLRMTVDETIKDLEECNKPLWRRIFEALTGPKVAE